MSRSYVDDEDSTGPPTTASMAVVLLLTLSSFWGALVAMFSQDSPTHRIEGPNEVLERRFAELHQRLAQPTADPKDTEILDWLNDHRQSTEHGYDLLTFDGRHIREVVKKAMKADTIDYPGKPS